MCLQRFFFVLVMPLISIYYCIYYSLMELHEKISGFTGKMNCIVKSILSFILYLILTPIIIVICGVLGGVLNAIINLPLQIMKLFKICFRNTTCCCSWCCCGRRPPRRYSYSVFAFEDRVTKRSEEI